MKIPLKTLALLALATPVAFSQSAPPDAQELAKLRRLEPERATQGMQFLLDSRLRNGLDDHYTFRHMKSITDPWGTYHGRFRQLFNGFLARQRSRNPAPVGRVP